nr:alpha/beta fold hydrolase [Cytophagales bacterium]
MPDIVYTDQGYGNPLILIHGFGEDKSMWDTFQKHLSSDYRVLCPDLPGFGESPLPDEKVTIEVVAEILATWISDLGLGNPVVIGHSLGGYVTLALAERPNFPMSGLGLFHSTAFADDLEKIAVRNRTVTFLNKYGTGPFVNSFLPQLFPADKQDQFSELIDRLLKQARTISPKTVIAYTEAMRDRPDRSNVMKEFTGEKMFIAGELDSAVPLENSRRHRQIATAYLELEQTGHMGMFEKPTETLDYIRTFLSAAYKK